MGEKNQQKKESTLSIVAYVVFSLVCSLLIWVYVTESNGGETDRPFPGVMVVFEGESAMRDTRGLVISERDTTSAKVTISGNRRSLSVLDSADLKLVIDLSDITSPGNYSLAPKVEYPRRIDTSTITSATITPEVISFYVDKLSVRPVPVTGVFNGSAAEGYSADPLEFDTETIRIYGPEKIISQVDHALVEVSRTDVDKTLNFEAAYTLIDVDGNRFESDEVTFDRETVNVTLPINAVKEVSLTVDLVPGAGATRDNVKWSIDPATITLTGDAATLDGVNSISIAKIDLSKVDEALTESYKIVLPNDTESTDGIKEATLTLEMQGLAKKTVSIEQANISCTNVSQGYEAVIMNGSLDNVVIRGPENVLRGITDNNVRAVADLTDYGTATGILSVPVRIVINGTTEAGAYGEYKVYINVTKSSAT
ncbi:MAG: hypothetical protein E7427_03215 [Ruminococcaceae bacterium]|jgi:YbbR domain-containing protein|nr:hypothetical protein [Oscillospiraceae bacterium]